MNMVQFHTGNNPKITLSETGKEILVRVLEITLHKTDAFMGFLELTVPAETGGGKST